jgi:hypothetical protein
MTMAAITPPEGRAEELFASPAPARAESAGTNDVAPPLTPVLDVTTVVVGVEIGEGGDDVDDSMISDGDTGLERGVAIEVELVDTFPTFDVCALAARVVGTGVLVAGTIGPCS